jgi:tRNA pseudouridine55 synthase
VQNEQALDEYLAPVESCVPHLPRIELSEAATFYMRKGRPVVVPNGLQSGMVRIADAEGSFLGVGRIQEDGKLAPMRLLSQ